jgi:hypothetical protein
LLIDTFSKKEKIILSLLNSDLQMLLKRKNNSYASISASLSGMLSLGAVTESLKLTLNSSTKNSRLYCYIGSILAISEMQN